jgi:hypothetical protein
MFQLFPPEEPAKTFVPSASFTSRAFATCGELRARHPDTVTLSLRFNVSRRQPWRIRPLGLSSSKSQFTTSPFSSSADSRVMRQHGQRHDEQSGKKADQLPNPIFGHYRAPF